MHMGWFPLVVSVVYGSLLVIVIAWLGQRAAKSLRPVPPPGGDTGDWIASVVGALIGFGFALALTRRGMVSPLLMPILQLCGLWVGAFVGSLGLRVAVRRP